MGYVLVFIRVFAFRITARNLAFYECDDKIEKIIEENLQLKEELVKIKLQSQRDRQTLEEELEDKDLKIKTLENTLSKYQEKISDLEQKNYGLVQDRELQGESL